MLITAYMITITFCFPFITYRHFGEVYGGWWPATLQKGLICVSHTCDLGFGEKTPLSSKLCSGAAA